MTDTPARPRQNRTAIVHVRMKPDLRDAIDQEAEIRGLAPSEVVRRVLVAHFGVNQ